MKHLALIAAAGLAAVATPAAAQVTVDIQQSGADVIATTSGSLNLAGLTNDDSFFLQVAVWGQAGYIATGAGGNVTGYFGFSGPGGFGSGPFIDATSGTGAGFAINDSGFGTPYVFVPTDYVSGAALSSTSLFANTTIAALGLNPGTYLFTLPEDTVTVTIGAGAAVPEPATWGLMLLGFAALGGAMRRRTTTGAWAA